MVELLSFVRARGGVVLGTKVVLNALAALMVVSVVLESAQGWSRQVSIYFCSLRLAVRAPALLRAAGLSWKARAPVRLERRGRKVGVEESGYILTAWVVAVFFSFPFSPFPCRGARQARDEFEGCCLRRTKGTKQPGKKPVDVDGRHSWKRVVEEEGAQEV